MSDSSNQDKPNCQFWSLKTRKCLVCNNGIFIPPDSHIETYCTRPKFRQCIQYALNSGIDLKELQNGKRIGPNRRRYLRVEKSHILLLSNELGTSDSESNELTTVETLDLSTGGMRLSSKTPLVPESVVSFTFGNEFPSAFHRATAQVQWCNKQIDDPGYHVGVAFQDKSLHQAMDDFLETNRHN